MRYSIVIFLFITYLVPAQAVENLVPTARELQVLPEFCKLKFKKGGEDRALGMSIWGQQFSNIHHYCFGLNWMNRYYKRVATAEAKRTLNAAVLEFTYMVDHLYEDGPLAGEILMNRGVAFMAAKRNADGLKDLYKALQYNPGLAKVYRIIARYYEKNGRRDNALEILEEGMKHVPRSNSLRRLYKKYGGKRSEQNKQ